MIRTWPDLCFRVTRGWAAIVRPSVNTYLARHDFYPAACIACNARSSGEKAVCPSVCQTRALWQNGRKICQIFYTTRIT